MKPDNTNHRKALQHFNRARRARKAGHHDKALRIGKAETGLAWPCHLGNSITAVEEREE